MPLVVRSTVMLAALMFAVTSGVVACGDTLVARVIPQDSTVHSVTVIPSGPLAINLGTKLTFSASVVGGPGLTDDRVTWSSSNTGIATVDQTGVMTADSLGTTTIIATSKADTAISGTVVVTIAVLVTGARGMP
jgi:uncharacterized protein YjdB